MRHMLAVLSILLSGLAFLFGTGRFNDVQTILAFAGPACLSAISGIVWNHRRGLGKRPEEIALGISVAALLQAVIRS